MRRWETRLEAEMLIQDSAIKSRLKKRLRLGIGWQVDQEHAGTDHDRLLKEG